MKADEIKKKLAVERARFDSARKRVWNLEEKLASVETYPNSLKLVGTYWTATNNYSCPSNESDYWPIYWRVNSARKDGSLVVSEIQIDKNGELSARPKKHIPSYRGSSPVNGWEKTGKRDWDSIVRKARKILE